MQLKPHKLFTMLWVLDIVIWIFALKGIALSIYVLIYVNYICILYIFFYILWISSHHYDFIIYVSYLCILIIYLVFPLGGEAIWKWGSYLGHWIKHFCLVALSILHYFYLYVSIFILN